MNGDLGNEPIRGTEFDDVTGVQEMPPFRLRNDIDDLAWNQKTNWQILSDARTTEAQVFFPGGGGFDIDLRLFAQRSGWTPVASPTGEIVPIEIAFDNGAFWARWTG
jgi:hypothetical protein